LIFPFQQVLNLDITTRLKAVASRLIDQDQAQVIVPPQRPGTGHWFGGGNMVQDQEGTLWLTGRFRNRGDSRTGLGAGERGLELVIYRSDDNAQTFQPSLTLSKADLNVGTREVLSIEGAALRFVDDRVELFVSTEKQGIGYPEELSSHLKPGTGVWTIDRLTADSIAHSFPTLQRKRFLRPMIRGSCTSKILFWDRMRVRTVCCSVHILFCWTSSNTGYVRAG
jgi:hypothetical protein